MSVEPTTGEREKQSYRALLWLLPLAFAATELVAHAADQERTVPRRDYREVGRRLRPRLGPKVQVVAAPGWTDPLLREQLGDALGVARAGAIDLEPFDVLYVVAQRGHVAGIAPRRPPDAVEGIGELSLERFDLGPSPVLYDFVEHAGDARATLIEAGGERACPLVPMPPRGGGLGQGPYWPSPRFACDPLRPWVFFAATVNEDRDLTLRRCLWQHPAADAEFRVEYADVPLGRRLVVDADLYYEHSRNEPHGETPFELRVRIDDRDVGTLRHTDSQGRVRMTIETTPADGPEDARARVSFTVTSPDPHLRTVCWSGSTRRAPREDDR